jgi:ribulose-5-phosphate 4-epimerase/fuculose-1-phosphate aldolase
MITAIGDVMRECYQRRWITTRDGNCSVRRKGSKVIYITPSGWRKNALFPELMVKIKLDEEKNMVIPDGAKPSGELHMHYLLLKDSPKTRAIVHAHPTHVVAAMYRGFDLLTICRQFPEIFRYTRVGPAVPALPAISAPLGEATVEKMGLDHEGLGTLKYDIVGQENHGVCSAGPDPWSAFEHIERLDHICEIILTSGVKPSEIAEHQDLQ